MTETRADTDRLSADLTGMVAIASINPFGAPPRPGHREAEMAADLRTRLEALGLETGLDEIAPGRPNVWGRLKGQGGGPTVLLAAHLDTVGIEGYDGALVPRVEAGRVHGRGSCDMKAALACYLETIRQIRERRLTLSGDVLIAGLIDEEDQMLGSRAWGRSGQRADFAIVGEPTGLAICPAHKGQLCAVIRTEGRATHSSRPELGINAVEHMAEVIVALSELDGCLRRDGPDHPLCGHGRFSMNVIQGGSIASAIPDWCELEVDRRFLPGESPADILADIGRRLDGVMALRPDLRVSLSDPSLLAAALDTPVSSGIVAALRRAVETVTGAPARIEAFPGATDAPNLGCPAVICGPGHLEQAHSLNEWVEVRQMQLAVEIYVAALADLAG
ncbi:Acetylornithine deacetylase [Roseibacterium elongatum DSM 19469]|uniref:Acetylornithine deacetylase n=1 Tax=Roseicyclus elongatus DSM 19469 TaxID=1294273 RepID=W8S193_9RHOB|nr:M20 family metallopeptidase [Roseibacterium elongatum]AHM02476.1 Acetylornithine deacetylase [Roseibacterium elongatum DSM 19469]